MTFVQDTPRNIHTNFGSNWSSSVRGEDFFKRNNIKNSKKNGKKTKKKGQLLQYGLTD